MKFSNPLELEDFLLDRRLVESGQLRGGGEVPRTADELLTDLERRGVLTSYQTGKLRRGETDGLRVGQYRLLYRNAAGSFARVFRGCSVVDGSMVGVKILRQRLASDPRAVTLFLREGELGKRLKHKNIVPIYEVGQDGDQHYITMEFVEGGNFRDFIKIRKSFSPEEATKYVLDIAEGLNYALGLGLTHRDLKLTNVLLSAQGVAKLVDFGLAGNDNGLSQFEESVDRAVEYAALERGTHAPPNDPRSDLYFLGAIYYELLTGIPPYPPTKSPAERKDFRRYCNIRPLRSVNPSLPTNVIQIVERLMEVNPDDRYQTPAEVIADLKNVIGQHVEPESPAKPSQPTVICVETRPKQQDALREYFAKHSYRVLMLGDPQRALQRLKTEHLAALVVMADLPDDEARSFYAKAVTACRKSGTAFILALSRGLRSLKDELADTPGVSRVLAQPVTLRDIRSAIEELRSAAKS
jgi:eukaryotic-like serine/threonine-protein kinase